MTVQSVTVKARGSLPFPTKNLFVTPSLVQAGSRGRRGDFRSERGEP